MKKIKIISTKDLQSLEKRRAQRETIRRDLDWGSEERKARTAERLNEFDRELAKLRADLFVGIPDLDRALDDVNGNARKHVYWVGDIVTHIEKAERKLDKHNVAQNLRRGVTITLQSEVPTTKSYARKSRQVAATLVKIERTSGAWYVTKVERIERWPGPGGQEQVSWYLPEHTSDAIQRNALADF